MTDSILATVKAYLDIAEEEASFDTPVKMHINAALSVLRQNGVGQFTVVKDDGQTWDDFKDSAQVKGNTVFAMVPQFVSVYVKIAFDPPAASQLTAFQKLRDELLWRLMVEYDSDHADDG